MINMEKPSKVGPAKPVRDFFLIIGTWYWYVAIGDVNWAVALRYMTCDAVDGKHARNTKQSTPLGAVALWTLRRLFEFYKGLSWRRIHQDGTNSGHWIQGRSWHRCLLRFHHRHCGDRHGGSGVEGSHVDAGAVGFLWRIWGLNDGWWCWGYTKWLWHSQFAMENHHAINR